MLRTLFAIFVFIHGIIHLLGYARAYGISAGNHISKEVTKPIGLVWLTVALLLVAAAISIILKRDWWLPGMIIVLISQALVIMFWKDAKAGTIANIVILAVAIISYAGWNFRKKAEAEAATMFDKTPSTPLILLPEMIVSQPPLVQKWLQRSGVVGNNIAHNVRLRQKGFLRTKKDGKWMSMNAAQYFVTAEPGFIWVADIQSGILSIAGKDKYENGRGHMSIKLASIFPVADARGRETDQGTMLRYLAEIMWFPSAAINKYITWTQKSDSVAIATISYGGIKADGEFTFSSTGDITKFEALRYMANGGSYSLLEWEIPVSEYKVFNEIRIPSRGSAIWKMPTGDFNWFNWEITDIEFNVKGPYATSPI